MDATITTIGCWKMLTSVLCPASCWRFPELLIHSFLQKGLPLARQLPPSSNLIKFLPISKKQKKMKIKSSWPDNKSICM